MNTFAGVRGCPVSESVMIVSMVAIGVEVYSNAAMADKTALFFRMKLISFLKDKNVCVH